MRGCRGNRGDVEEAVLDNCLEKRIASLLLADEKDIVVMVWCLSLGDYKLDNNVDGKEGRKQQVERKC